MVYILDNNGNKLTSTARHGRVRHLINQRKAVVVNKEPFTVQLLYPVKNKKYPTRRAAKSTASGKDIS